jgi:hypothetical protein
MSRTQDSAKEKEKEKREKETGRIQDSLGGDFKNNNPLIDRTERP